MYEPIDIYIAFRKAQADASNRGYRIPKNFEKHMETKMSAKNREALLLSTKYFNTKWNNINIDRFFECGFEIFKSFSYMQFFNQKVLNLYKVKDKNLKREMDVNKKDLLKSFKWVKHWISKNEVLDLRGYCRLRDGSRSQVVEHYLHNHIDKYFVVQMIDKGYLKLTDEDRALVPYIVEQYRECLFKLEELKYD
jgi:hypothetical protein